jgi:predicted nucleic acid-binding protein
VSRRAFLDTNILIYAAAQQDLRTPAARDLLRQRCTISVQVLNEFTAVAHRKLGRGWREIGIALNAIRALCQPPVPITLDTHQHALLIAERTGYRFYDSLILASALRARCDTVFSEDMADGQRIENALTIVNPFRL